MRIEKRRQLELLLKNVAICGGDIANQYFRTPNLLEKNKSKSGFDPVTAVDVAVEKAMVEVIKKHREADSVFGEEMGLVPGSSKFTWILDPIDGTRAFISGIPLWTVLVAINDGIKPILGAINQPFTRELLIGGFEKSVYLFDGVERRVATRKCSDLKSAILSTTFPEIGSLEERLAFESISERAKLTRYGLDAYGFALIAMGQIDIIIEAGLKSYDVQAPIAVIEGAGGVVTDWQGKDAQNGGRVLACGDKDLHQEALELLSRIK
ncbi:MAG: inositol monophosphatase family protein [Pseudomonadota bacterium]|nr:inositol monophosphatase family protein [Pseudomonadota bacterium]